MRTIQSDVNSCHGEGDDPRTEKQIAAYQRGQDIQRKALRDRRQWERYKAVLGEENVPSYGGFRRMKQAGSEKWQQLREQMVSKKANNTRAFSRNMANGLRQSPYHILTEEEQRTILTEAEQIGADQSILSFNTGSQTGFSDQTGKINVRGDIFPDLTSVQARDIMSSRAVLAHEYYGHYQFSPSAYEVGDWRDEMRASYIAALKTPGLTREERSALLVDAYDRAKASGYYYEYSKRAREIIYGY